jgi:F-type H+-transporting ATPase subunit c
MEMASAIKALAAGLAVTFALGGIGIGIGNISSNLLQSVARNPAAQPKLFPIGILCIALTEAVALFALLVAFLILFV